MTIADLTNGTRYLTFAWRLGLAGKGLARRVAIAFLESETMIDWPLDIGTSYVSSRPKFA
jgi:hypothetical protein